VSAPALAPARTRVELCGVWKWFTKPTGEPYPALGGIDLAVASGEFLTIVGPSGCGKSTILRLVAGLDRPSEGEVRVDGRPVDGIDRRVGFLFQQDALLPWRSVAENVGLGLKLRGAASAEVAAHTADWIARVGLRGFERSYPAQLSGGMRKRVAIAQTLIYDPEILLMDEPFTHLDAQTRHFLEEDLLALCGDGQRTILFVTHDLDEAIGLGDRVALLTAGPASVVRSTHEVGIARPRDLQGIRREPRFGELSALLWRELHEEVSRSYGR
jgi:NitT/TauT family transport system ATP-binding protein